MPAKEELPEHLRTTDSDNRATNLTSAVALDPTNEVQTQERACKSSEEQEKETGVGTLSIVAAPTLESVLLNIGKLWAHVNTHLFYY
jgi:hypothetical protein